MQLDMFSIVHNMFAPIFSYAGMILSFVAALAVGVAVVFVLGFFVKLRIVPFFTRGKVLLLRLARADVNFLPYDLFRWLLWDFLTRARRRGLFRLFGFTLFVGRQGSGKTISMIQYLNSMKKKYPKCLIVTNFQYSHADFRMSDWKDFLEIRNGEDGVIFAIDEIHSEYSSANWKDFPENLLSEISQQRKQKIKIVATSQVFSRVAKPIREQAFSVIVCNTYLGRLTTNKEYDCAEYATSSDNPYTVRKKVRPIWRSVFAQSNYLRGCYDTYEKIERMKKIEFIPRNERH